MNTKESFVITISREIGSGGRTVGKILAERLGVRYCDKDLIKALRDGQVTPDQTIMLNITGGGEKRFKKEFNYVNAKADLVLSPECSPAEIIEKVTALF